MADRVMRAVALIEANDQASAKFQKLAKTAENVAGKMNLVEKASVGLNKAMIRGGDVTHLTRARDVLGKTRETVTRLKSEFEAAQAKAKALGAALKQGGDHAAYDKATASVKRLSAALERAKAAHANSKASARRAMGDYTAAKAAAAEAAAIGGGSHVLIGPGRRGAGGPGGARGGRSGAGITPLGFSGPAIAATAVLYGAKRAHDEVADAHHDFQRATLKQQAILDLDPQKQKSLQKQAVKIGQDTQFTNADIVRAQTDIGGKLAKEFQTPETIAAITEATKNYALAMEVSMQEGGAAVVGWMKARGYDLSSPKAAAKSATRAANQMVQFAKTSGAKHHDLIGDTKFGAAPGRVAGYSEEFSNAMSAQLIRIGYEGAMAGNFVRGSAMRLSAPSSKGMAAIAASGLNYNDYVKPGADPSADGLNRMLKLKFGRTMNDSALARVKTALEQDDVRSSPENFVAELTDILVDTFAKRNKKGGVNAQDAERVAKTVQEFFNMSTQGVDVERLMTDLIRRGLSPALAKYLFGQEHGGRAQSLNADQLEKDKKVYQNVPDDRAEGVANKVQEGAQGAYMQMVGSIETFKVALGESTDGLRAWTYKGVGGLFDVLTKVVKGERTENTEPVKLLDWSVNRDRILENAERDRKEFQRDPEGYRGRARLRAERNSASLPPAPRFDDPNGSEAARGNAMMARDARVEAVVKPDQITAKAEVSGEASVAHTFTVNFNAGAFQQFLDGRIASQVSKIRLHSNGAGSTGVSSPDAQ